MIMTRVATVMFGTANAQEKIPPCAEEPHSCGKMERLAHQQVTRLQQCVTQPGDGAIIPWPPVPTSARTLLPGEPLQRALNASRIPGRVSHKFIEPCHLTLTIVECFDHSCLRRPQFLEIVAPTMPSRMLPFHHPIRENLGGCAGNSVRETPYFHPHGERVPLRNLLRSLCLIPDSTTPVQLMMTMRIDNQRENITHGRVNNNATRNLALSPIDNPYSVQRHRVVPLKNRNCRPKRWPAPYLSPCPRIMPQVMTGLCCKRCPLTPGMNILPIATWDSNERVEAYGRRSNAVHFVNHRMIRRLESPTGFPKSILQLSFDPAYARLPGKQERISSIS